MTLEATSRDDARQEAVRTYRKARLLSFAIFLVVVAMLYSITVYVSPFATAAVLILALFLVMTPLGNAYTSATVWAGKYVSSCPYCPLFGVEDCEIQVHECDTCSKFEGEVTGVLGGGWITSHSDGKVVAEYCSWGCRNAASNGGDSA